MNKAIFLLAAMFMLLAMGATAINISTTCPGSVTGIGDNVTVTGNIHATDDDNCIALGSNKMTLDCNGYSITGNNVSGYYGIVAVGVNITIKNCIIAGYPTGAINAQPAANGLNLTNIDIKNARLPDYGTGGDYDNAYGIILFPSYNTLKNVSLHDLRSSNGYDADGAGSGGWQYGIYLDSNLNTTLKDVNLWNLRAGDAGEDCCGGAYDGGSAFGIYMYNSKYNTGDALYITNITQGSGHNGASDGSAYGLYITNSANNTISNSSFPNIALYLLSSSQNYFYWNRFNGTSIFDDNYLSGTNKWNKTEGNLWQVVLNGTKKINGTVASAAFAGLYIGNAGLNYPYNFTYGIDYAPLTPTLSATAAAVNCSTLSTANHVYELIQNATTNTSVCFTVAADNITINCNGYTIKKTNGELGIGITSSKKGTVVKNCIIRNLSIAMEISNSNVLLQNITAYLNTDIGFEIFQSNNSLFENIKVYGGNIESFWLWNSHNLTIKNSVLENGILYSEASEKECSVIFANVSNLGGMPYIISNNNQSATFANIEAAQMVFCNVSNSIVNNINISTIKSYAAFFLWSQSNNISNAYFNTTLADVSTELYESPMHRIENASMLAEVQGLYTVSSPDIFVKNSLSVGTTNVGSVIFNTSNGNFINFTATTDTGDEALLIINSNNLTFANSTFNANWYFGAVLEYSNNNMFTNTLLQGNDTALVLSISQNNTFLNNTIRGAQWVTDLGNATITNTHNSFNNSKIGNKYLFLNGTGAWTKYTLLDYDGDMFAEWGYINSTNAVEWISSSSGDYHPFTLTLFMPPPPPGRAKIFGFNNKKNEVEVAMQAIKILR